MRDPLRGFVMLIPWGIWLWLNLRLLQNSNYLYINWLQTKLSSFSLTFFLTYKVVYYIIITCCAGSNAKYNYRKKEGNNVLYKLANLNVLRF